MYFSSTDIYQTGAEAIVVPVRLGSQHITQLQQRVIEQCGDDYVEDLMDDIHHGNLSKDLPSFYVPAKDSSHLMVINFPIPVNKYTPGVDLSDLIVNFRALFAMCENWHIGSFAVGDLENGLGWDQLETIVMRMESSRITPTVEVWYHPPVEKDDDVMQIEAEVVNA